MWGPRKRLTIAILPVGIGEDHLDFYGPEAVNNLSLTSGQTFVGHKSR